MYGLNLKEVIFSIGGLEVKTALLVFIVVGFIAQSIDGALGMAYGVSSNAFLLSLGVPVPVASASVHMAEVATTAVSGISHHKLGNIDKKLFKKLIVPGIIGSVIGAYGLTFVWQNITSSQKDIIKVIIALYLFIMGGRILLKALNLKTKRSDAPKPIRFKLLAFIGGFSDAIGGGGWGPIVTTTLVSNGHTPRYTIGSVNAAEFFVTLAQVIVFILALHVMDWQVIAGLIIGGCISAPFAAKICKHVPTKAMMIIVGVVIIGLQTRTLMMKVPGLFG